MDKLYDQDGQSDTYNYNSKTGYLGSVNDLFFAEHYAGHFEVFSIGADAILLEEYETLSGLSFSFGIGAGIDWVHGYTTTNQTIFKSYDNPTSNSKNNIKSNTNNKSNTVNQNSHKVRCCRACGRPDYICPSPVYY